MNEHDCIDMKCSHFDGDMCTLGFCEPDVEDNGGITAVLVIVLCVSTIVNLTPKSGLHI